LNNTLIAPWRSGLLLTDRLFGNRAILENYVLRIYRRKKSDPRILVGVVEEVGVEGNRAFSNIDELWSILNSSKAVTRKRKKRNKSLDENEVKE